MKYIVLISSILISASVSAQVFPIHVVPQLVPPYSPYLSDYTMPGTQNLIVQVSANDVHISHYPCKLRIVIEGAGITLRTKTAFVSKPLILHGGIPQVFYGEDLGDYFHPDALDFSGMSRREYETTGRLPEGVYRFTVEVLDYHRGTVVSNSGIAIAWIVLNDPPMLNLPSNSSQLNIQGPTNILFAWTPRHSGSPNAAFTTEYTFRLVEVWPDNRNPNDALLTQLPLFETTTTHNQILYGAAEPALIPGKEYAWQVHARDAAGRDLFRNDGRSEVFVFQYGAALAVPENLQLRWAKPTTLSMRWDPVAIDGQDVRYRLQYRTRLRREDHRWYETRTQFTEKTLYHLQSNTDYEMRVRTELPAQESEYSEIRVFKTLPPEKEVFVCKDPIAPPPPPDNTLPLFPLSINDTLRAGGYDILVRDVMEVEGKYFGSGMAIVPWLNAAKVRVAFENIRVNDRFWLTSGVVKSVWNPESVFLLETQRPTPPGNAPKAGELDITILATDSVITVDGTVIAAVTKDEEGNVVVTTTDGKQQTLPAGGTYSIADQVGNGYVVDEKGNIAKTTALEAKAVAARGARQYDWALRFLRGTAQYGFDEKIHNGLAHFYQRMEDGSYVPWKALSTARPDDVEARLLSNEVDIRDVLFELGGTSVAAVPSGEGSVKLALPGRVAGLEEELLALHGISDTLPLKVVGKLNLATYVPLHYNLEIVPVNGALPPAGLDASAISSALNSIYNEAVVVWRVTMGKEIEVNLPAAFDDGETGVFSNYTKDMQTVLKAHGLPQDNTYYLFLVDKPRNPASLGYMPRSKRAGFVFVDSHRGNADQFLKTVAHELGHGAFNLKHTFTEHNIPLGTTDNVMDYGPGTSLFKYQWDHIHDPQSVVGLFEEDEDGQLSAKQFESKFLQTLSLELFDSECKKLAFTRGYDMYQRFDIEIGIFAGFLRLLLCETEKENCKNIGPLPCGFTNGLLQELDWIATLESVEGWNIDPEEILKCALNSIPIGSKPDEDLTLSSILFKCLVGIEMGDLQNAIKDFIIANFDEPYYQGQAAAFAITLLSPFKAKLLEKLSAIPRYAKKISGFKIMATAKNSSELIKISKSLTKLIDDVELQNLSKSTKFLPGPILPPKVAATFSNSLYTNRKLVKNERYFKYHGRDNRTRKKYTWLTNRKYSAEKELREGLAIRDDWNIDIEYVSEFDVPAGTWVSEGQAASQGTGYPGGEYQAVILNIPKVWIIKTTKPFKK